MISLVVTSGQNLLVVDFDIKCAAAVSGADIDNTFLILPTEEEESNAAFSLGEDNSRFATWRNFLVGNGCDVDTLPRNSSGSYLISGMSTLLLGTVAPVSFFASYDKNFPIYLQCMNLFVYF